MAEDNKVRGRFVWYELMTTDPEGAQSFYTQLIGWGTQAWDAGPAPYTMWTNAGESVGGVMELPEQARKGGAPPHWLCYVGTPNVDETVAAAAKLGATTLVPPQDIPQVGRFAVLADPQGAVFCVFTPSDAARPEAAPKVGEVSWHELATSADTETAFGFYRSLFGWEKTEAMDMGPMGVYQMFGRKGGEPLGGIYKKPAEMPAPPHWLAYVLVPDVDALVDKVKTLGGQVLNGPMEVPGGDRIAQCMDPQGAAFALHSKKK